MDKRRAAAAVVTVWTDPHSVRLVDKPAVTHPPDLDRWLEGMTREENIALCREKRVQTQVLFGEEVLIDDLYENWAKIIVPSQSSSKDTRGYPGWVPAAQLAEMDQVADECEKIMVKSKRTPLFSIKRHQLFELSFGTQLPLIEERRDEVVVATPMGSCILRKQDVSFPQREQLKDGSWIVSQARRFLDLPYLWAGLSAYGYDCSGFSYAMLRSAGYLIPRDADDQSENGCAVLANDMRPGDLLFFAYEEGKGDVHHVGIYSGDGKMIHSPTPGLKISETVLAGSKYEKERCAIRRYWKEQTV